MIDNQYYQLKNWIDYFGIMWVILFNKKCNEIEAMIKLDFVDEA